MAGLGIRLHTDEMIPARLAEALRARDYDAMSCHEIGRANRAIADQDQLRYAAEVGGAILTFNMVDYVPLDQAWKAEGRHHSGIVVSPAIDELGMLLRAVQQHLDKYPPEVQNDLLLWLDTGPAS